MFDLSKITSVYSGYKGCACGCRGKYTYTSAHRNARPDYYIGDEGVNDRVVKTIVTRIERLLREGEDVEKVLVDDDGEWIAVDLFTDRTYTIYFAQ